MGICPFHGEKTPSFSVNPKKDIFKCFGCGVGGDQIYLFAKLNGIENGKAIEVLKKRIGIAGKKLTKKQKIEVSKRYEDKLLEKQFEQECKTLFNYLCSLRNWMKAQAKTYDDMEQVKQDVLLVSYYHESHYHLQLLDELELVILDEIDFEQQIEIYKRVKEVAEDWMQLLVEQEPIFYDYTE
jgi:hypothetical protein